MRTPRSRTRGGSLIEALVAMAILSMVLIGVLQTFALALVSDHGSSSRTQLTYKCQQVVEVVRLSQFLVAQGNTAFAKKYKIGDPNTGVLIAVVNQGLPYTQADAGWDGWGPSGSNVIEQENDAYRLFYTVEAAMAPSTGFQIRVSAMAVDSPELPTALKVAGAPKQQYRQAKTKRVDYVAQIQ